MTAVNDEIRAWARARGEQVSSRGNLSRKIKERFWAEHPEKRPPGEVQLLPSPEEAWASDSGFDDMGLIEPEPEPAGYGRPADARAPVYGAQSDAGASSGPVRYEAVPDAPEPPVTDSGPAHAGKDWRKGGERRDAPRGGKNAPRKVSVTVRTDISAKISLVLEVPGRVWQARDPVCGSAFIEQRPAIADALTEIVCGSPDLVAWFTGSGGQFMLWFNLVMACWPVAMTFAAHHVYHTIDEQAGDALQPDYGSYAA